MNVTKRQLLIASGATLSGGFFAVSKATQTDAQTSIQMGSFDVEDTEASIKTVNKVPITVTVLAQWESTGADTLEIELFAGLSETSATNINSESYAIAESGEETFEISGDILSSADLDKTMLRPEIGPSVNLSLGLQTTLKGENKELDTSELWETAELSVNDDIIEGSLTTGATGEITVQ